MIDCTNLFPPAEWAAAHLHGPDMVRINIQYANHVYCVHVQVSELANFLERIRRAQENVNVQQIKARNKEQEHQRHENPPSDPAAA